MAQDDKNNCPNEVCKDAASLKDKHTMMEKTWYQSFFFSMKDSFQYIAGILTAASLAIAVKPFAESLATNGLNFASISSGMAAVGPVGLTFLAASAVMTGAAVMAGYTSSRYYHNNTFDQMEVNAQHVSKYTAKALVQELKQELQSHQPAPAPQQTQQVVFNNPNACRADGKTWVEVSQTAPEASRSIH